MKFKKGTRVKTPQGLGNVLIDDRRKSTFQITVLLDETENREQREFTFSHFSVKEVFTFGFEYGIDNSRIVEFETENETEAEKLFLNFLENTGYISRLGKLKSTIKK